MSISLGSTLMWRKRKRGHKVVRVDDTFQYVPLLSSLKVCANIKAVELSHEPV